MSLLSLPPELLTSIVVFLDIPSAFRCQRVCQRLLQVADSESIFRELCIKAEYLKPDETLEDLVQPLIPDGDETVRGRDDGYTHSAWKLSGRHEDELHSYKSFLVGSWKLDWEKDNGDVSYSGGTNNTAGSCTGRIKIDHIRNVIAPSGPWYFQLCDMHTGRSKGLTGGHTSTGAHYDYDQGWSVQMSTDGDFGILHEGDILKASRITPQNTPVLGYHLKFPHLLVVSPGHCTFYDIITKDIIQDVHLGQEQVRRRTRVLHIDFDADHIWICFTDHTFMPGVLCAYCRQTSTLLWTLHSKSWPVMWATTYFFRPADTRAAVKGGRVEQLVRPAIDDEAGEELDGLGWEAAYPDYKTGCLCLVSGSDLIVIPNYKNLPSNWTSEDCTSADSLIVLRDIARKATPSFPTWVTVSPDPHQPCLAVADGRAAFRSQNGVALVDLQKLLALHRGKYRAEDDPRGAPRRSDGIEGELPYSCMNVWSSPYVFGSNMYLSSSVALTSTCLAWAGSFQSINVREVPEQLQEHTAAEVYASEQLSTVFWVDFARLRDHEVDSRRQAQEEKRAKVLNQCEGEMKRRIAANGSGKYTLKSGIQIGDVTEDFEKRREALVALLLGLGEFEQLNGWVDWGALRAREGQEAVIELRGRILIWQETAPRDRSHEPADRVSYLRLTDTLDALHTWYDSGDDHGISEDTMDDDDSDEDAASEDNMDEDDPAEDATNEESMDEDDSEEYATSEGTADEDGPEEYALAQDDIDLQIMAAGIPPMNEVSEIFQDFFDAPGRNLSEGGRYGSGEHDGLDTGIEEDAEAGPSRLLNA